MQVVLSLHETTVTVPGDVEEDGLEEEGEADPLVVLVVLPARPVPGGRRHPGVRYLASYRTTHLNSSYFRGFVIFFEVLRKKHWTFFFLINF